MKLNIDQVRDHLRRGGADPETIASVATVLIAATRTSSEQAIGEMTVWRKYHVDQTDTPAPLQLPSQTEIEEAQKRTGIGVR